MFKKEETRFSFSGIRAVHIKGFNKFREKLPALSGKKIIILPILAICMITIAFAVYVFFDSLPDILAASGINEVILSFFPLFGVIIMQGAGFFLVWQLWLWRDHLKAKYGPISYQRVILIGFAGITCIITVAINQYIPYYSFAQGFWASSPLQVLATPLESFFGIAASIVFYIKDALAVILFIIGLLTCTRAIQTFGLDYMFVVYLYFPEESQIQKNEIYSILRHPVYAGGLLIALGGAFLTFTLFSFATYVILLTGFYLHVHLVEEKELIQRFGNSYREYRMKVPAFFVSLRNIRTYLRFLFKNPKRRIAGTGNF
jgi:protein-S-isoprenylcysteine O-methyltransferase Ste14